MLMFRYNGKEYVAGNLDKKLRKLGITKADVELYESPIEVMQEEKREVTLYKFKNKKTDETITSIYNDLDNLIEFINLKDWIKI